MTSKLTTADMPSTNATNAQTPMEVEDSTLRSTPSMGSPSAGSSGSGSSASGRLRPSTGQPTSNKSGQRTIKVLTDKSDKIDSGLRTDKVQSHSKKSATQKKVDEYVKHKRSQDDIKAMRAAKGSRMAVYDAVVTASNRGNRIPNLNGGSVCQPKEDGSFFSSADGRLCTAKTTFMLAEKQNWSYSFEEEGLGCSCCRSLSSTGGTTFTRKDDRQLFVLADQSFPAVLAAQGGGHCPKIIRMENGTLEELVAEFLRIAAINSFHSTSVVLIFSASQLSRVGTAAYCEEFVAAKMKLVSAVPGLIVGPLPPLLMAGASCARTIRSTIEMAAWATMVMKDEDGFLEDTFGRVVEHIKLMGNGVQADYDHQLKLPTTSSNTLIKAIWSSGGWGALPSTLPPLGKTLERSAILSLLEEVNLKLALCLDLDPNLDRSVKANTCELDRADFLIVGSSNASKLAAQLDKTGHAIKLAYLPSWRATKTGIAELLDNTKLAIRSCNPKVVVFCILDNNVFFGRMEDGELKLANRCAGEDRYHVEGELVVAGKEEQFRLFRELKPVLEQCRDRKFILVSPMARYASDGCCSNPDHMANRSEPDFLVNMYGGLNELASNYKNFLFSSDYRNSRVYNPCHVLRATEAEDIWAADPVHPVAEIYAKLAAGISAIGDVLMAGKRKREVSGSAQERTAPPSTRGASNLGQAGQPGGSSVWTRIQTQRGGGFQSRGGYQPRGGRGGRGNWGRGGRRNF